MDRSRWISKNLFRQLSWCVVGGLITLSLVGQAMAQSKPVDLAFGGVRIGMTEKQVRATFRGKFRVPSVGEGSGVDSLYCPFVSDRASLAGRAFQATFLFSKDSKRLTVESLLYRPEWNDKIPSGLSERFILDPVRRHLSLVYGKPLTEETRPESEGVRYEADFRSGQLLVQVLYDRSGDLLIFAVEYMRAPAY